jgi:hypothetical protein
MVTSSTTRSAQIHGVVSARFAGHSHRRSPPSQAGSPDQARPHRARACRRCCHSWCSFRAFDCGGFPTECGDFPTVAAMGGDGVDAGQSTAGVGVVSHPAWRCSQRRRRRPSATAQCGHAPAGDLSSSEHDQLCGSPSSASSSAVIPRCACRRQPHSYIEH